MKKLLPLILLVSSIQSVSACEFTSLKANVKVESRNVDYSSHKEKIQKVGSLTGKFIKNQAGDHRVFSTSDYNHSLESLSIAEKYDYYTTTVRLNTTLTGETIKAILKEAIGEKKLRKDAELAKMVNLISSSDKLALSSNFYKFSGYSYGEVDDETEDSFTVTDPANKDHKLIVTVDFNRKTKCD